MFIKENNTEKYLLKLLEKLTDETVIVTRFRDFASHTPSILKFEDHYQIYIDMCSQYNIYDSTQDIVNGFMRRLSHYNEDDYYFDIISKEDFEKLRHDSIVDDLRNNDFHGNNENYNLIKKEVEKYSGTYVITSDNDVKFLIAACSSDEDFYYIYLDKDIIDGKVKITMKFQTCVGHMIPLIDRLSEKEYKLIQDYCINETIETLDPKTLRPGHEILSEKLKEEFDKTSEYVLFTPITLIRDEQIERT